MKKSNLFKGLFNIALASAVMVSFPSCGDKEGGNDDATVEKKIVSINEVTETVNTRTVTFGNDGATEKIAARISGLLQEAVTVSFDFDNTLVDEFNTANETSYEALPSGAAAFVSKEAKIDANRLNSDDLSINFTSTGLTSGKTYLAPVTITSVSPATVAEASDKLNTLYLLVTYDLNIGNPYFASLDMSDYNLYSNFVFDEPVIGTNYTIEFKFYADELGASKKFRIGNICDANEGFINMIRFGERANQFEWFRGKGLRSKAYTNSDFMPGVWYLVSMVFDGEYLQFYVDGEASGEPVAGDMFTEFEFQRLEIGSSWSYSRQENVFDGRIAEMRIWSKALSVSEIAAGICSVDPQAEGLEAYWKFNEGAGHIFNDATGNGYDMDWSKSRRDDGSGMAEYDYSEYVKWLRDENNVCE